jgi:hypothetical protein
MSNTGLTPFQKDNDLLALVPSSSQFPYMKLCTSNSSDASTNPTLINSWLLVRGKDVVDLGKSCAVRPLAFRAKATDKKVDPPITMYGNTPRFKEIMNIVKNHSGGDLPPYMAGIEFLVYTEQGLATLYLYNKSGYNIVVPISNQIGQKAGILLGSKAAEAKKGNQTRRWTAPTATICEVAPEIPEDELENINSQVEAFAALVTQVEVAEQDATEDARPQ